MIMDEKKRGEKEKNEREKDTKRNEARRGGKNRIKRRSGKFSIYLEGATVSP